VESFGCYGNHYKFSSKFAKQPAALELGCNNTTKHVLN